MNKALDAIYRELLSRVYREILKPEGFKKEGGNFRLIYPNGLSKIINFQRSMYNDNQECRFCINVGLYFQEDPQAPNLRFKEYECTVRQRAAILAPYGRDFWWSIFEGVDTEELFDEMQFALEEVTLPWLDQFASHQDVIRARQAGTLRANVFGKL